MVTGTDKDGNLDRQLFQYLPRRREKSEPSNYYHIFMQITLLETCKNTPCFSNIYGIIHASALAIKRLSQKDALKANHCWPHSGFF